MTREQSQESSACPTSGNSPAAVRLPRRTHWIPRGGIRDVPDRGRQYLRQRTLILAPAFAQIRIDDEQAARGVAFELITAPLRHEIQFVIVVVRRGDLQRVASRSFGRECVAR